jgi:DNA polymerase-3 subunit epsilon
VHRRWTITGILWFVALDFTSIDFETANGFRGSACSVGLSRVRNGKIVEETSWLMRPPKGFDHFDARNVMIHRITADMVKDAPRFGELFTPMANFIGTDTLVAHNAAFDLGVIRSALEVSELSGPAFDYACTVKMARRTYELSSYSLPFVAEEAGSPMENHHDALADARACAHIMIDIARRQEADEVAAAAQVLKVKMGFAPAYLPGDALSKATRDAQGWAASGNPVPVQPEWAAWPQEGEDRTGDVAADPAHPLYGEMVVFTGNLRISRQVAKDRAAERGANTASRVTRATTVLVVGDGFVPEDLSTGRLTGKAKRVLRLQEAGQPVAILAEGEFLQLIDGFDAA